MYFPTGGKVSLYLLKFPFNKDSIQFNIMIVSLSIHLIRLITDINKIRIIFINLLISFWL